MANKRTQVRLIDSGSGYLCQQEPVAHFGLGSATNVTSVTIQWPDGVKLTIPTPTIDKLHTIKKPRGWTPEPAYTFALSGNCLKRTVPSGSFTNVAATPASEDGSALKTSTTTTSTIMSQTTQKAPTTQKATTTQKADSTSTTSSEKLNRSIGSTLTGSKLKGSNTSKLEDSISSMLKSRNGSTEDGSSMSKGNLLSTPKDSLVPTPKDSPGLMPTGSVKPNAVSGEPVNAAVSASVACSYLSYFWTTAMMMFLASVSA